MMEAKQPAYGGINIFEEEKSFSIQLVKYRLVIEIDNLFHMS